MKPAIISMLQGTFDSYWRDLETGVRTAETRLNTQVDFLSFPGEIPSEKNITQWQNQTLERFSAEKNRNAVAVAPLNHSETTPFIKKLVASGAACITFDTDAPDSGRHFFVGTNNHLAGSSCAYKTAQLIDFKGKVAIHTPTLLTHSCAERIRGFSETLKRYDAIQLVKTETGEENPDKLFESAKRCIAHHQDLSALFAVSGTSAKACARAILDSHLSDKILLVCFDIDAEIAASLMNGSIFMTTAQRPHTIGYRVTDYLYRIEKTGLDNVMRTIPPSRLVDTGTRIVTLKTLDSYRESLKGLGIPIDF
ncbi:MAG: substrate-binding domain-containing protein [bacterium]